MSNTEYTTTVDSKGTTYMKLGDRLHSLNNSPAIERADGSKAWYYRGKLHRGDGLPAKVDIDGNREWYIYGRKAHEIEAEHFAKYKAIVTANIHFLLGSPITQT